MGPLGTAVVQCAQILQSVMLQSLPQQSFDRSVDWLSICICAQCEALSAESEAGIAHDTRNGASASDSAIMTRNHLRVRVRMGVRVVLLNATNQATVEVYIGK